MAATVVANAPMTSVTAERRIIAAAFATKSLLVGCVVNRSSIGPCSMPRLPVAGIGDGCAQCMGRRSRVHPSPCHNRAMPLDGVYAPGKAEWARKQAELYEASGGQEAADLRGRPIIVLTSVGAKTGKLRKTALMRVEHDGDYAVVASNGRRSAKHPVWYFNLKANPHVELQDGAVKRDYLARELTGDERATWWARAVDAWPDYAKYQAKTTRQIPVFVLEPLDARSRRDVVTYSIVARDPVDRRARRRGPDALVQRR